MSAKEVTTQGISLGQLMVLLTRSMGNACTRRSDKHGNKVESLHFCRLDKNRSAKARN